MRAGVGICIPGVHIPTSIKTLYYDLSGVFFRCLFIASVCLFRFYCKLHTYSVHPQVQLSSTRGKEKSHIPICAYPVCQIFQTQNLKEAIFIWPFLDPGSFSWTQLCFRRNTASFISRDPLQLPDTDFNSDSTSTPTFCGAIREIFPVP